jgi:hypothetical protein
VSAEEYEQMVELAQESDWRARRTVARRPGCQYPRRALPRAGPLGAGAGGEANGEWNRLVSGNAYGVPTDKQAEEIFDLLADIPQSYALPDGCWEK